MEKGDKMKPYGLVIYNFFRITLKKLFKCKNIEYSLIEMLNRHMKIDLKKDSKLHLGKNLVSDGWGRIIIDSQGKVYIGDRVYFNESFMISCKEKIEIGEDCRFGPNVKIFDNDHRFDARNGVSAEHKTNKIKIGKSCWIASNVVILKGTEIGDNCVIGAGCVVQGKIPSGSIVTQDRKLIIKPIQEDK